MTPRAVQEAEDLEAAERGDHEDRGFDEPPAQGQQGHAAVYRLEGGVEGGDQDHIDGEGGQVAGDAQPEGRSCARMSCAEPVARLARA